MKKMSSFLGLFFTLLSRKRPSTADDPEPDLHYSTEDHTQHEEKKNCEQRSRNFPPRWNKSVAVIQCKGKIYCGTCVDFFFSLFCWTSGLSLWAGDFLDLLAHCLVSKKVSVEH